MFRCVLAGWLSVLIVSPCVAQSEIVFTEAEFLSALDESHPAVVESSEAVTLARADIVAASALENPNLDVVREDPSGPAEQIDWTISWQLPPASRRLLIAAQREKVIAAEARRARQMLKHRLEMRQAYAKWAIAAARRARLTAQVEQMTTMAAREQVRVERGESAGWVARRLSLAAAGLRARLALVVAAEEGAAARVRSWYPALSAAARPMLPALGPAPQLNAEPPEVRAAEAELEAAKLQRAVAGRFVRSPELVAGWQHEDLGSQRVDGPIFGVSWSLPLFARKQAERTAADARVVAAGARLERTGQQRDAQQTATLANYRLLQAAVADAELAGAGNQQMLHAAEAAFLLGEASLTDLLETRRAVSESEMTMLDLYQAALAAQRQLERLAGNSSEVESTESSKP